MKGSDTGCSAGKWHVEEAERWRRRWSAPALGRGTTLTVSGGHREPELKSMTVAGRGVDARSVWERGPIGSVDAGLVVSSSGVSNTGSEQLWLFGGRWVVGVVLDGGFGGSGEVGGFGGVAGVPVLEVGEEAVVGVFA